MPVTTVALNEYLVKKPVWTIEDDDNKISKINNVIIARDSLSGTLSEVGLSDHQAKNKFRVVGNQFPKKYLHLYLRSSGFSDVIKIPLSEIATATTHKNAVGTSIAVTAAWLSLIGVFIFGALQILQNTVSPY